MSQESKKVLVTAGSTNVPIDRVRCISNIFKGGTGTRIAEYLSGDHEVTLITSDAKIIERSELLKNVISFKTYDELMEAMKREITGSHYDAIIHSAAVSDYKVAEVCVDNGQGGIIPIDSSGKVSSEYKDIFLHMVQTEKIIDLIRSPWGFKGYLVKFKLQVGISDKELLKIAEKSRKTSRADMIVANCLEWFMDRAYVITEDAIQPVPRKEIARKINEGIQGRWVDEK